MSGDHVDLTRNGLDILRPLHHYVKCSQNC